VRHLRIVKDEPSKAPRKRRPRERLFGAEEERALRAALLTLRGIHGSWPSLAREMGIHADTIENAANGRKPISGDVAIRAARVARQPLEALLSPVPRSVAS
jgi:hypothetical protein